MALSVQQSLPISDHNVKVHLGRQLFFSGYLSRLQLLRHAVHRLSQCVESGIRECETYLLNCVLQLQVVLLEQFELAVRNFLDLLDSFLENLFFHWDFIRLQVNWQTSQHNLPGFVQIARFYQLLCFLE